MNTSLVYIGSVLIIVTLGLVVLSRRRDRAVHAGAESQVGATSTGLRANVAALLCYILGWISAIVFLLVERDNRFVRLHAVQSLIVTGIVTAAFISLNYVGEAGLTIGILLIFFTPIYLIASMFRAYQGKGLWLGHR